MTFRDAECDIAGVTSEEDSAKSNALVLEIHRPSSEEERDGVVAHFMHPTAGWSGTVNRGPNGLVISRLVVTAPESAGDGGVTSRALREVPVGRIIDEVRVWSLVRTLTGQAGDIAQAQGIDGPFLVTVGPMPADEIMALAGEGEKPSPGRAALPDALLRAVAEGYLQETGPGKPRGAVKRLAATLQRPEQTVSRWVARARKEGWLGPGTAGREGAEPGPRLIEAQRQGDG